MGVFTRTGGTIGLFGVLFIRHSGIYRPANAMLSSLSRYGSCIHICRPHGCEYQTEGGCYQWSSVRRMNNIYNKTGVKADACLSTTAVDVPRAS